MAFCATVIRRRASEDLLGALRRQADERPLAPVGRLTPVGCAAVGIEAGGIAIGVEREVFDRSDTRILELRRDESGEIELMVAGLAGLEEASVRRVVFEEPIAKTSIHLVAGLGDRRPDGGADPASLCAERKHLFHRIGKDAFLGAAPACMGGGDHARFPVRKQNGCAVRRHHAYQQAGGRSDQRVDSWPRIAFDRPGNNRRVGRMYLERHGQTRTGQHGRDGAIRFLKLNDHLPKSLSKLNDHLQKSEKVGPRTENVGPRTENVGPTTGKVGPRTEKVDTRKKKVGPSTE